jgi:hypothetical protein
MLLACQRPLAGGFSSKLVLSRLRIESSPQFRRNDRAEIVPPPENTVTNARQERVEPIPQRARNYSRESRYNSPSPAEPPKHVNARIRAREERDIMSFDGHAVGQAAAPVNRHSRLECLPLQRGKAERRSRAVMPQDELHRAMTQAAMPIVKDDLGFIP